MKNSIFVFVMGTLFAGNAHAAIIGVDAAHGFDADGILASGADFDTLRSILTDMGHTIVPVSTIESTNFAGLDAFLATIPYAQNAHSSYSTSDISALHLFGGGNAVFTSDLSGLKDVEAGSDLPISFGDNAQLFRNIINFVVSNHAVAYFADAGTGTNVENFNALVAPYGVEYSLIPVDGGGWTVSNFVPHVLTTGLDEIGVDYHLPMSLTDPAVDLTIGGGSDNVLAVVPEPATLALLLIGLFATNSRRKGQSLMTNSSFRSPRTTPTITCESNSRS